jgi:hypothetical protein
LRRVREPLDPARRAVTDHVNSLTCEAQHLLVLLLQTQNRMPPHRQDEIREWGRERQGGEWVRALWFAAIPRDLRRIDNYPQVAAAALRWLRDHALPTAPTTTRSPETFVLTTEDKSILRVLADSGRALLYSEICRSATEMVRAMGGTTARNAGLVLISETKLKERVPLLERHGLVSRPLGQTGEPTSRKGIGITDEGRARLNGASSLAR